MTNGQMLFPSRNSTAVIQFMCTGNADTHGKEELLKCMCIEAYSKNVRSGIG